MRAISVLVCLLVISSFSVVSTAGQTGSKRAKKPAVRKIDPQIIAAEKAWPGFVRDLGTAFTSDDRQTLRKMMTKDVSCGTGPDGNWIEVVNDDDGDTRDECLANWKTEHFLSHFGENVQTSSLLKFLSQKPCRMRKSEWRKGTYVRSICLPIDRGKVCSNDGYCLTDGFGSEFVFSNGQWFLADFGSHEVE